MQIIVSRSYVRSFAGKLNLICDCVPPVLFSTSVLQVYILQHVILLVKFKRKDAFWQSRAWKSPPLKWDISVLVGSFDQMSFLMLPAID